MPGQGGGDGGADGGRCAAASRCRDVGPGGLFSGQSPGSMCSAGHRYSDDDAPEFVFVDVAAAGDRGLWSAMMALTSATRTGCCWLAAMTASTAASGVLGAASRPRTVTLKSEIISGLPSKRSAMFMEYLSRAVGHVEFGVQPVAPLAMVEARFDGDEVAAGFDDGFVGAAFVALDPMVCSMTVSAASPSWV